MNYDDLNTKLLKGKDDKYFVAVVPVSIDGAVLLGKRTEDGIWTTPGGGAESHEAPEQAARRELFEEAGLVADPGELELVAVAETPRGYKIFSYLWRMPVGATDGATSKLDPDKEVKSWKLYRPEDFPGAMGSEQNEARLTTIREALMKFHGVSKADVEILSLVEKLNKGGEGSGVRGHRTARRQESVTSLANRMSDTQARRELISEIRAKAPNLKEKELNERSTEHLQQIHAHHHDKQWDKIKSPDYNSDVSKESGGVHRNKKTGKTVPTQQFYNETASGLMNHSGFSDKPGHFMSMHQVASAVTQETGWEGDTASDIARALWHSGRIKQLGKIFAVVKKSEDATVLSLIDKLSKGGPGSGIRGHKTSRSWGAATAATNLRSHPQWNEEDYKHLRSKGYKDHEVRAFWDRDLKDQKKPVSGKVKAPDATGHAHGDQKVGNKDAERAQNMAEAHRQMVATSNEAENRVKAHKVAQQFKDHSHEELTQEILHREKIGDQYNRQVADALIEMRANKKQNIRKGGPGSGVKGHHTVRREDVANARRKEGEAESPKGGMGFDEAYVHARDEASTMKEEELKAEVVAHHKRERLSGEPPTDGFKNSWIHTRAADLMHYGKKKQNISKGGPGSGVVGHTTAKPPSPLHPAVGAEPAKPVNKLQSHLQALQHGGVMPGINTKSGKPVVNDMEAARAHNYDVQDHIDAMNAHHELAQKTSETIQKLKTAGHKVPEEGKKIVQFHEKKMREHMAARQYLEERKKHTSEAFTGVKKSTTQMGGGLGDRDLDISAYAQARDKAHDEWLEKLYSGMKDSHFGDLPVSFKTDKGTMHLAKVDDGLYSGYFTNLEADLEDNARVRIERITLPELVQLMTAKEWISPVSPQPEKEVEPTNPAPVIPVPTPASVDRGAAAATILSLLDKLLG